MTESSASFLPLSNERLGSPPIPTYFRQLAEGICQGLPGLPLDSHFNPGPDVAVYCTHLIENLAIDALTTDKELISADHSIIFQLATRAFEYQRRNPDNDQWQDEFKADLNNSVILTYDVSHLRIANEKQGRTAGDKLVLTHFQSIVNFLNTDNPAARCMGDEGLIIIFPENGQPLDATEINRRLSAFESQQKQTMELSGESHLAKLYAKKTDVSPLLKTRFIDGEQTPQRTGDIPDILIDVAEHSEEFIESATNNKPLTDLLMENILDTMGFKTTGDHREIPSAEIESLKDDCPRHVAKRLVEIEQTLNNSKQPINEDVKKRILAFSYKLAILATYHDSLDRSSKILTAGAFFDKMAQPRNHEVKPAPTEKVLLAISSLDTKNDNKTEGRRAGSRTIRYAVKSVVTALKKLGIECITTKPYGATVYTIIDKPTDPDTLNRIFGHSFIKHLHQKMEMKGYQLKDKNSISSSEIPLEYQNPLRLNDFLNSMGFDLCVSAIPIPPNIQEKITQPDKTAAEEAFSEWVTKVKEEHFSNETNLAILLRGSQGGAKFVKERYTSRVPHSLLLSYILFDQFVNNITGATNHEIADRIFPPPTPKSP